MLFYLFIIYSLNLLCISTFIVQMRQSFVIKGILLNTVVQGRTGMPNRPEKFSLTGPHYRAFSKKT